MLFTVVFTVIILDMKEMALFRLILILTGSHSYSSFSKFCIKEAKVPMRHRLAFLAVLKAGRPKINRITAGILRRLLNILHLKTRLTLLHEIWSQKFLFS